MKPVTYDFDVVTDAPPPRSRPPERAEPAPQPRAQERPSVAPPEQEPRVQVRAAE